MPMKIRAIAVLPALFHPPLQCHAGAQCSCAYAAVPVVLSWDLGLFFFLCLRNAHSHGNQYSTLMQQPSLLTNHVTLATAQPLNVGVAHVVRQQQNSNVPAKKNKQPAPSAAK